MRVTSPGHIESIQWLRFVAATLVVVYHSQVQISRLLIGQDPLAMSLGASGVDLFFVISGFVMVYITYDRPPDAKSFLLRRIMRVVPLYWLFTFLMIFGILVSPNSFRNSVLNTWHTIYSFIFIPAIHPVLKIPRPLLAVGWTLTYEMFFYCVFAALLSLALFPRVIAVASLFLTLILLANARETPGLLLSFYGSSITFEFIFGMLIAMAFVRGLKVGPALACGSMLIVVVAFSPPALLAGENDAYRAIFWGLPAAGIVLVCLACETKHWWPSNAFIRQMGDASYSIYLSHLFVVGVVAKLIEKLDLAKTVGLLGLHAVLVACSLLAGWGCYYAIERPLLGYFASARWGTHKLEAKVVPEAAN